MAKDGEDQQVSEEEAEEEEDEEEEEKEEEEVEVDNSEREQALKLLGKYCTLSFSLLPHARLKPCCW